MRRALRAALRFIPVLLAAGVLAAGAKLGFTEPPKPVVPPAVVVARPIARLSTVAGAWPPRTSVAVPESFTMAEAINGDVHLFGRPGQPLAGRSTLTNPTAEGLPLAFLVVAQQGDWLQVRLPVAPNGSLAWVLRAEVTLRSVPNHITIELGARRITVTRGTKVVFQAPIAVGRAQTPTPLGSFFIEGLVDPVRLPPQPPAPVPTPTTTTSTTTTTTAPPTTTTTTTATTPRPGDTVPSAGASTTTPLTATPAPPPVATIPVPVAPTVSVPPTIDPSQGAYRLVMSAFSERSQDPRIGAEHLSIQASELRGAIGQAITGGSIWLDPRQLADLVDLAPAGTPVEIIA